MNIYAWLAVALVLFALLMRGNIEGNKKYIFVACLLLFCVMGLRDAYSIGVDASSSYLYSFEEMADTDWSQLSGKGDSNKNIVFSYFMKAVSLISDGNYQTFIGIISAFEIFAFGRLILKYSRSPIQSIIYYMGLWFYTFNFSALKQGIAMAILFFAFDAIIEKKPVKFVILSLLASTFHFPAIVFLPAYWIAKLKLNRSFLLFLAALMGMVLVFRDRILDYMLGFYDVYGSTVFESDGRYITGKVTVMALLVVGAYILRRPGPHDDVYRASMQLVAIAVAIQLFSVYDNVFERLADYYFQFAVIFVPFIFEKSREERKSGNQTLLTVAKSLTPYALCGLCIMRYLDMVSRPAANLLPYAFCFFK